MPDFERFYPPSSRDFIGHDRIKKAITDLRNSIRSGERILLYGPPGTGKTSATILIAKECGFEVIETNASDERKKEQLKSILSRCQHEAVFGQKVLFLLDEVDGVQAWKTIEQIINKSRHPVVMTANEDWKIPKKIKDLCTTIRFEQPYIQDVLKYVRELTKDRKNVDFSGVSQDMRSSLMSVFYGGEKYSTEDIFSIIEGLFKRGEVSGLKKSHIPYLIDNAPSFLNGVNLYVFYYMLEIASRSKLGLLKSIPKGHGDRVKYPYYLKRMKVLRGKKK